MPLTSRRGFAQRFAFEFEREGETSAERCITASAVTLYCQILRKLGKSSHLVLYGAGGPGLAMHMLASRAPNCHVVGKVIESRERRGQKSWTTHASVDSPLTHTHRGAASWYYTQSAPVSRRGYPRRFPRARLKSLVALPRRPPPDRLIPRSTTLELLHRGCGRANRTRAHGASKGKKDTVAALAVGPYGDRYCLGNHCLRLGFLSVRDTPRCSQC